ncbi:hypothetical protein JYK21_02480 [Ralstonia pickettii]|nr:hypothetical protein [Ralstonia pickettii]
MKKRLKKKLEKRYALLKQAKRQKYKKRGRRYIAYELVPMGETDKIKLENEGYSYPFATHWFVEIATIFTYYKHPYVVYIYPSTSKGIGQGSLFLQVATAKNPEDIVLLFNKIVEDMKNDRFWDADYAAIFD